MEKKPIRFTAIIEGPTKHDAFELVNVINVIIEGKEAIQANELELIKVSIKKMAPVNIRMAKVNRAWCIVDGMKIWCPGKEKDLKIAAEIKYQAGQNLYEPDEIFESGKSIPEVSLPDAKIEKIVPINIHLAELEGAWCVANGARIWCMNK